MRYPLLKGHYIKHLFKILNKKDCLDFLRLCLYLSFNLTDQLFELINIKAPATIGFNPKVQLRHPKMAIITISRGSYSHGKEIAETVAHRLGYGCVSREVLLEASKEFNIPELKLFHALHDSPSLWDNLFSRKEKYIAYIQAAVLKNLKNDNVVYHGFAGHFFVQDIAHVLKVRIIATLAERVNVFMKATGSSHDQAVKYIEKIDEQRRKWSQQLYHIETTDPSLYDLVINIGQLTIEDAVEIICHKVGLKRFRTTAESRRKMEDRALAAVARAAIVDRYPSAAVTCLDGTVSVAVKSGLVPEKRARQEISRILKDIPEIRQVKV